MHLYLATGNPHKIEEVTAILAAANIAAVVHPPSAVGGMPDVVEDTGTFEGNARKKALALVARLGEGGMLSAGQRAPCAQDRKSRQPSGPSSSSTPHCAFSVPRPSVFAVADDSGLCVEALGGAPGVESAYYAGTPSSDAANSAKLLARLRDVPPERRTATFFCCIVAAALDGTTFTFEGRCPGRLLAAPRGAAGFGYDPLFVPDGEELTAAELPPRVKNRISHRARALARFVAWLRTRPV